MTTPKQPWRISFMIHRDMMCRDFGERTLKANGEPLESLEDCKQRAEALQQSFLLRGYQMTSCTAYSPEGEAFTDIAPTYDY
jgi:hypothetical protein